MDPYSEASSSPDKLQSSSHCVQTEALVRLTFYHFLLELYKTVTHVTMSGYGSVTFLRGGPNFTWSTANTGGHHVNPPKMLQTIGSSADRIMRKRSRLFLLNGITEEMVFKHNEAKQ